VAQLHRCDSSLRLRTAQTAQLRHDGNHLNASSTDRLTTTSALRIVFINRMVDERDEMTDQLSRVFAALADPTRRDMVARLTDRDATVGDLAAPYDVSLQAVSKHLKVLEEAGLVTRSRDAQRRPVHLEAEVFDLMTKWIERYRQRAEERFQRLDAVLADLNDEQTETETPQEGTAS
jgi:DNA-binding transcriptional ArsR family regulator